MRAHFLVEGALVNKLILQCVEQDLVEAGDRLSATEIEKIRDFYDGIAGKSVSVMSNDGSNELIKLHNCLLKYKGSLGKTSQTAKLWLQYIEYVETVKLFIRAERTGNWNLHLIAVGNMMNLLLQLIILTMQRALNFICN